MTALHSLEIPDLLSDLVDRSLVVVDGDTWRYELSESMRAYALTELGDESQSIRARHFQYFAALAEPMLYLAIGGDDRTLLKLFSQEIDNIRLAMEWSSKHDPKGFLHLATCTAPVWARLSARQGLQHLTEALQAVPEENDADHIWARSYLAHIKLRIGEIEGVEELLDHALRQLDVVDIPLARATTLLRKAWLATWLGDSKNIKSLCAEVIDICQKNGFTDPLAVAHLHLGDAARSDKDWLEAERSYRLALSGLTGSGVLKGVILFNHGAMLLRLERIDEAEKCFREVISTTDELFDHEDAANNAYDGAVGLGYVALKRGNFYKAGLLLGNADARRRSFAISLDPLDQAQHDEMIAFGKNHGGNDFQQGWNEGEQMSMGSIVESVVS